jgi:nitrite reductase (NADH) large subunit
MARPINYEIKGLCHQSNSLVISLTNRSTRREKWQYKVSLLLSVRQNITLTKNYNPVFFSIQLPPQNRFDILRPSSRFRQPFLRFKTTNTHRIPMLRKGGTMHHVIIGNGIAGACAAEAIRQTDRHGRISIISDENLIPYSRPMISMVLEGAVPSDRLAIRPARFYEQWGIEPILGNRVNRLDVDAKTIGITGGTTVSFDKLLIATGADARPWKTEGSDLKQIFYMRTQADVKNKLAVLSNARRALVLGGGLVGFKAAYALLKRGLEVTMLITSDYPLSQQVDETAGKMILDTLVENGLKVRVGASVESFEGVGTVSGARISDGTRLPCDMVVIGKGVLPALSFVPRDRIDVDLGIMVDEMQQTSQPDIYAAGDVAEAVDIARQKRWVNAIWPEAAVQGRIAGLNMAGRCVSYAGSLSRNVMRVMDLDVMTLGVVNPTAEEHLEVIQNADGRRKTYRKLVFRDEFLVGAMLINDIEQGGLLRALIQQAVPIRLAKHRLLSHGFNFGQLLGPAGDPQSRVA